MRRTPAAFREAISRKPSCLISCGQSEPDGGRSARDGAVRVFSDAGSCYKASLKPAADRWTQQFGAIRLLDVRLTPARLLHDRLIQLDASTVFVVDQSFKDLAERAHTSLVRMDEDSARLKIAAYTDLWQ